MASKILTIASSLAIIVCRTYGRSFGPTTRALFTDDNSSSSSDHRDCGSNCKCCIKNVCHREEECQVKEGMNVFIVCVVVMSIGFVVSIYYYLRKKHLQHIHRQELAYGVGNHNSTMTRANFARGSNSTTVPQQEQGEFSEQEIVVGEPQEALPITVVDLGKRESIKSLSGRDMSEQHRRQSHVTLPNLDPYSANDDCSADFNHSYMVAEVNDIINASSTSLFQGQREDRERSQTSNFTQGLEEPDHSINNLEASLKKQFHSKQIKKSTANRHSHGHSRKGSFNPEEVSRSRKVSESEPYAPGFKNMEHEPKDHDHDGGDNKQSLSVDMLPGQLEASV